MNCINPQVPGPCDLDTSPHQNRLTASGTMPERSNLAYPRKECSDVMSCGDHGMGGSTCRYRQGRLSPCSHLTFSSHDDRTATHGY